MNIRQYLFVTSFVLVLLQFGEIHAQRTVSQIDSLKMQLTLKKDSAQADIYNSLSWSYRNINSDSAYFFGRKAYEISKIIDYSKGITLSLNYQGIALRNQSKYHEAMALFFEALKLAEQESNVEQISYSLVNIGNIYLYQKNFEGAYQYFDRALGNAIELADDRLASYSHLNLARALIGMERYEQAEKSTRAALRLRQILNDQEGIVIANLELAQIHLKRDEWREAEKILHDILPQLKALDLNNSIADSYLSLAKIKFKDGSSDESKEWLHQCFSVSIPHKLKRIEIEGLKLLAEIQETANQPKKALATFKLHLSKKDSVFNTENSQIIADLFSRYTYEKSEIEKSNLQARSELNEMIIKRQQTIIILSIVVIVSFIVIGLVSYRSTSERRKLHEQIKVQKDTAFKHNNELIDINNEKNNLIRILSHDLRAPINNIKGLTQVHQLDHEDKFTESENEVLNLIKSESDRLLNMIKKILNVEALEDDSKEVIYDKVDVNAIAKDLVAGFQNSADAKEIKLLPKYLEEATFILGDDIHLYQVMENLLSNALKFTEKGKKISIDLHANKNKVSISFSDEGPGLTEEDKVKIFTKFQTLSAKPTGDEDSTGLGLSIVKKYVQEMNGQVWYESKLDQGTTFHVEFDQVSAPGNLSKQSPS